AGPAGPPALPGEKLFFPQPPAPPPMDMGVLQWSRHHRLFPRQGAFDLVDFLDRVLAAGYEGPLSLEVFNDVFRQAEPRRTAVDGLRSLLVLQEQVARRADASTGPPRSGLTRPPAPPATSGWGFGELSVDGSSGPALTDVLTALGFTHTGQHRSKPVQLWEQDGARTVVNWAPSRPSGGVTEISALAVESADAATSVRRAESLLAPLPAPTPRA